MLSPTNLFSNNRQTEGRSGWERRWEGTGRNRIKKTISKMYYVRKKWCIFNKGRKHSEWKRLNGGEFGQVVAWKIITEWLQVSLKVEGAVVQPEGCENRDGVRFWTLFQHRTDRMNRQSRCDRFRRCFLHQVLVPFHLPNQYKEWLLRCLLWVLDLHPKQSSKVLNPFTVPS